MAQEIQAVKVLTFPLISLLKWTFSSFQRWWLITQEKTVPLNRAMPQLKVQILNILDFEGFWQGNSFTLCHVPLKNGIS